MQVMFPEDIVLLCFVSIDGLALGISLAGWYYENLSMYNSQE
jgi:hypothetical protein